MKKTIGILAHVDAGKTTLSEQLLYHTKRIRTRGRVDHKDTFLDNHPLEKQRGITIFSDQASFEYQGDEYYLVDTPGHVDFSAEMERVIQIMDYAIVVVSCVEGVQGHTLTVWNLLKKYKVPLVFFLNKTDREGAAPLQILAQMKKQFSKDIYLAGEGFFKGELPEELIEGIAEQDSSLLQYYLETGYDFTRWLPVLRNQITERKLFLSFQGSALLDQGIQEFLDGLSLLTQTSYEEKQPQDLCARVYKVRYDEQGKRLTFLKILSGVLRVKDMVSYLVKEENVMEKVNEIRFYNGKKYQAAEEARAGDLCAVAGISGLRAGDGINLEGQPDGFQIAPLLMAKVIYPPSLPAKTVWGYFKQLEDEDPMLEVVWNEALQEMQVHIMGAIQLEVLKELVKERFNLPVEFGECQIMYKETIASTVIGYGHFEPLRHYAEVHLKLSPGERGSGVVFFDECSGDILDSNYRHLVRTHVLEKQHKGVLTGSPLTDVVIALVNGRAHEKHTEGGDFREAVYRAVRQGLEQAENVLLEPMYAFRIKVSSQYMGRVISDIQQRHGSFQPPQIEGQQVTIIGRAPAQTMMNYHQELVSFTQGKGILSLSFDGYEPCHNSQQVIEQSGYEKDHDPEATSDSVFCAKGAGYNVKWYEVHNYIHCK